MRYPSKDSFIQDIEGSWEELMTALGGLSDADLQSAGVCARWSIKDMMADLTEWHKLALGWYKEGLKGNKPAMPCFGYKWSQVKELNHEFYIRNKDRELKDVRTGLKRSHATILKLIKSLSEEQLLNPGFFAWTIKYPLTTYFHANTSGHYRWALKHIKKWKRGRKSSHIQSARLK